MRLRRWLIASLLVTVTSVAAAQSAADKATARQLATEGIELYQSGKYVEALDKLERAEALFDAPVHLLYIARAQVKLDKLVEAAENYRRLVRVKLEAGAPDASQQAVTDAKKELSEVEPTIPSLKVTVTPEGAKDLELTIDGEKVSSAVVGVDRPLNPGEHTVAASASGYQAKEAKVKVARGEKQNLELALAVAAGGAAPASTDDGAKTAEKGAPGGAAPEKNLGFFIGLRLFGAVPAGDAATTSLDPAAGETKVAMSDVAGAGGGFELSGGLRFARYFAGKLYLDAMSFKAGGELDSGAQVTGFETGLGLHVGTPAHHVGGFGEIGLGFVQQLQIKEEITVPKCTRELGLNGGPSLRIGGGAVIPLGKYFHLTPFMLANFAQYSSYNSKNSCVMVAGVDPDSSGDIPSENRAGHQLFLLGIGMDWLIGG